MHPQTYQMVAARQDTYWFQLSRRAMSVSLLKRYGLVPGCRWLDLGCGPGGNLKMLDACQPELVVGVDLSPIAMKYARSSGPGAALVQADISHRLPFADGAFDLLTIFNVLHSDWVINESETLAEVVRVLRPGGLALMTEPAFPVLAREMDAASMGSKRYRRGAFALLCRNAGLEVLFTSYFASFGFPILLTLKALKRIMLRPRDAGLGVDMKPLHPLVNKFMHVLATIEAKAIVHGLQMPFGTTLVCVARKT